MHPRNRANPANRFRLLFLAVAALLTASCIQLNWTALDQQEASESPLPLLLTTDLLLTSADLQSVGEGWRVTEPTSISERWAGVPLVDAYSVWALNDATGGFVRHEVLRFSTAANLNGYWPIISSASVEPEWNYARPIDLLNLEDLPETHADRVAVLCEEYSDDGQAFSANERWCTVRLTYGPVYSQLTAHVGTHGVSSEFVQALLPAVDQRLRRISEVD